MSTPNKPQPTEGQGVSQPTISAPTLRDVVVANRRRAAERDGSGEEGGGGESQVITRQINPMQTPEEQGGMQRKREVTQPQGDDREKPKTGTGDGKDPIKSATAFLGKKLFGERFQAKPKGNQAAASKPGEGKTAEEGQAGSGSADGAAVSGKGKEGEGAASASGGDGSPAAGSATPAKVTIRRQSQQTSPEQLSRIVAETTASVLKDAGLVKPKEGSGATVSLAGLSEEDREDLTVMQKMAELWPDSYSDLPTKMVDAVKKRREYSSRWEAENPGKKIDWEDQEHAQFLATVEPAYDRRHFRRAEASIVAQDLLDEAQKKHEAELRELRRTATEPIVRESAKAESGKAISEFTAALVPNAGFDLTSEAGRQAAIDANPVVGPVMARRATELETLMTEAVRIYDSKGAIKFDPANNQNHRVLKNIATSWEQQMSKMDPAETVNDDGQTFVTREQYGKLSEAERRNHWTIGRNEMLWFIRKTVSSWAKSDIESELQRQQKIAKSMGMDFKPESFMTQAKQTGKGKAQDAKPGKKAEAAAETNAGDEGGGDDNPPASGSGNGSAASGEGSGVRGWSKLMVSKLFPRDTGSSGK